MRFLEQPKWVGFSNSGTREVEFGLLDGLSSTGKNPVPPIMTHNGVGLMEMSSTLFNAGRFLFDSITSRDVRLAFVQTRI